MSIENPNEYNDEKWARWSSEVQSAIGAFWEAGGTVDELQEVISNALGDVGTNVDVELIVNERTLNTVLRRSKKQ